MSETIYLNLDESQLDGLAPIDTTKADEFDAQSVKIMEGFETLRLINEGIARTPKSRLKDPAYVAGLESQVSKLANSLGLESYSPVVEVSQEGAVWDTLKRWFIAVLDFLKKVGKFLWEMLKGFLGIDRGYEKAAENLKNEIKAKAHQTTDKGDIIFKLPTRALTIFHTSKFKPKVDFKYNYETCTKSQKQILLDSETVAKAILEDVLSYAPDIEKVSQAMLDRVDISPDSLTAFSKSGRLGQLAHNKFSYMGAQLVETPVWRRTTGQQINKVLLVGNTKRVEDGTVDFVIRRDQMVSLAEGITTHISDMNKQTAKAMDAVISSKTITKLKFAEQVDVSTIFNDEAEENLHKRLQRMLAEANDIVGYVKTVTKNYGNFSNKHVGLLTILLKELNAGL